MTDVIIYCYILKIYQNEKKNFQQEKMYLFVSWLMIAISSLQWVFDFVFKCCVWFFDCRLFTKCKENITTKVWKKMAQPSITIETTAINISFQHSCLHFEQLGKSWVWFWNSCWHTLLRILLICLVRLVRIVPWQ